MRGDLFRVELMLIKERATILSNLVARHDQIVNDKGLF